MNYVTIYTYSYGVHICKCIEKRLKRLRPKRYRALREIKVIDTLTMITYYLPKDVPLLQTEEYLLIPIAEAIAELIQGMFAKAYAGMVIADNTEICLNERAEVQCIFNNVWAGYREGRLVSSIIKELKEYQSINIEGFLEFRLKSYKKGIVNVVDRIVAEYAIHRDYEEFLELLEDFVEGQIPVEGCIHIMPGILGEAVLYDAGYKKILIDWHEKYELIENQLDITVEDLILSVLLTMAPAKIVIHKEQMYTNTRLMYTMQVVYGDRITVCKGCKGCNDSRKGQI